MKLLVRSSIVIREDLGGLQVVSRINQRSEVRVIQVRQAPV